MNRKRLSELTIADLLENEVWEYCLAENIEYVSPSEKNEVSGDSNEVYIVVTDFIFKNNSKHVGFCSPHDSGSLDLVQPVVLSDKGPVEFYKEAVKNEVEKVHAFILHQKEQTEKLLKKNIKENVNIAHVLITEIYLQNQHKDKNSIKKIIKQ